VHWQEPARAVTVHLRLGDVLPLLTSATGRCFAAYAQPAAIAQLLKAELAAQAALRRPLPHNLHSDVPTTLTAAQALFKDVRQRGLARVCDSLLPGIAAFCAPVFDANGHLALGLVSLGSVASFDVAWDGAVACALKHCAQQLSNDLGAPV
jgi:DNA-binding IclR family transcriptional regulator